VEERKDGRERRGLGTQMGRKGVVWDREGEEGYGLYRGKGWEERKRERRKEGGKR
jgi:hypothetical protein